MTTPVVMGKGGEDPQTIVRGDVTRKPMPIAAFREAVRLVISQGAGQ